VSPLWFVWDGTALWLSSIVKSQRWADVMRNPRVSIVVDAGEEFRELRGVELLGLAAVVGDVPRGSGADERLAEPERLFARKYRGRDEFFADGRHAWLRVVPEKVVSWDYRKHGPPDRHG
jgi:hypothetical protein